MRVTDASQLFYWFGSTDHLVPWDKLHAVLKSTEPLSQQERCALLLRAVNGDQLSALDWKRLVGAPLADGLRAGTFTTPEEAREPLRAALGRVVEDPGTAIDAMGRNINEIRNDYVLTVPVVTVKGRTWKLQERVVARYASEALIYALSLFVDPAKPFGKSLRRCAYAECGRFALAGQPTGRPGHPPKYFCNAEHAKAFKRAESLERMHRMRASRVGISIAEFRRRLARAKK
jgi:hypothetical protein